MGSFNAVNEIAIFDLDGTLIDLQIDAEEFERRRSEWAFYLTSHGVCTTLKPLLPELKRISQTTLGKMIKADILKTFDDMELACRYNPLGTLDTVLDAAKSKFRKLVMVTHNSSALWSRLTQENQWTRLIDTVITRDDMTFFKPDPRVCESVFESFTPGTGYGECWVIGDSDADRSLGSNLREKYSNLIVRTFLVRRPGMTSVQKDDQLDMDIQSVDSLPHLLQNASF
jgi:phosphoglycolate phosphatase-like HAD superfamily hydrolase